MNTIIRQLTDRFPEPEFSLLRDAVFNDIEQRSLELAEVIAAEKAGATAEPSASSHYPMSRFGAYVGEQLIGWSSGHLERGNCFYMASSGVIAEHRNKGVYSGLLEAVLLHAQELGAQVVRSQHSVLNNTIILCKLRRGFHRSGLSSSGQMGTLVELVYHISLARYELFRSRVIPFVAPR